MHSKAITTVIQNEIVLVANKKNILRKQYNSAGPKNVMPKMDREGRKDLPWVCARMRDSYLVQN